MRIQSVAQFFLCCVIMNRVRSCTNGLTDECVNLCGQHLPEVPENLPSNITCLNLAFNNILQLNGSVWAKYMHLTYLSLAKNQIETLRKDDFTNLPNLQKLDLSLNKIRYCNIHSNIFGALVSLEYLDLKQDLHDIWRNESYHPQLWGAQNVTTLMIDGIEGQQFPSMYSISEVYMSGTYGRCHISRLDNSFGNGIEKVEHLYLSDCGIKNITKDTFLTLTNITSLDLSNNTELTLRALPNVTWGFNATNHKKRLNFNSVYPYVSDEFCTVLKAEDVIYMNDSAIEMLTLDSNHIIRMDPEVLFFMPNTIKYTSIRDNMLSYGKYIDSVVKSSLTQRLLYFDSGQMFKIHVPKPDIFPVPFTNDTDTEYNFTCVYMFSRTHHKTYFEVIDERLKRYSIGNSFTNENTSKHENMLEYLDLSENLPGTIQLALRVFNGTPHLKVLNLSHDYLGYQLFRSERPLIRKFFELQTLDLSENKIFMLRNDTFRHLINLLELYLSQNSIREVNFDLSTLKQLKLLDLRSNQLEIIGKKARHEIDKLHNLTIYIKDNNFKCSCDSDALSFLKWISQNRHKFGDLNSTNCTLVNKDMISLHELDYARFERECRPSQYHTLILLISLCLVAFIIVVSCALIYRFKWNLRYLYYMTKFKLAGGYQPIDDFRFDKDVFVSYSHADREFVINHVIKELEEDGSISLLVHDRDFQAGEFVADNIMKAITSTRMTLVIMTKAYVTSKWCMYEMNMARLEGIDSGRNVLCVVLKDDIPMKDLSLETLEILRKKTYLEFPPYEEHERAFWERLKTALHH